MGVIENNSLVEAHPVFYTVCIIVGASAASIQPIKGAILATLLAIKNLTAVSKILALPGVIILHTNKFVRSKLVIAQQPVCMRKSISTSSGPLTHATTAS